MLYLAIPAHNEAATIGVLLWRLRTVLAEFPREYEAVVYDDASSDSTSEILESYARVMPLTILRGERRVGYAGAVDALIRHVVRDTRYPRRDAMLLLQGDFTDSPTLVPEFVKRFEGGTDVVVGERGSAVRRKAPTPVRRLLRAEPWLLRFLVRADGIRDLTGSYRLVRISVLRDLLRSVGDAPVCVGDSRTANADLLMRLIPLARRVETLPVEPTWEVRLRETRVVAVADGMNLLRWAWKSRGLRAVPSSAPEPAGDPAPRQARGGRPEREGRPELRLESRSDSAADGLALATDNTRTAGGRDARNGRKARPARGEGRSESRSEGRSETRSEPRAAARGETRPEPRKEGRDETRTHEPRARLVETEPLALAADGDPTQEKPARRKRSRRGGRDRDAARVGGEENAPAGEEGEAVLRSDADGSPYRESPTGEAPEPTTSLADEVTLSPGLSAAVEDAELALDGEGRQRPRRKRRRRGSRSGRREEGLTDGDTADGGQAEDSESSSVSDDVERGDNPDGSEAGAPQERSRHSARRGRSEADADVADGGAEDNGGEDSSSDDGDDNSPEGAEARTRRRGRRGRRGGSRRNRSQRGEASGEGAPADGDAGPPPPREPSGAPDGE